MTAEAAEARVPTRTEVWERWGAPTEQVGSVNDPRTREEHGVSWNEKWVYRAGGRVVRVALWHRYDLAALFRVERDGSVVGEVLSD